VHKITYVKMLQLLGDFDPRSPTGASLLEPTGGLPSSDPALSTPSKKLSNPALSQLCPCCCVCKTDKSPLPLTDPRDAEVQCMLNIPYRIIW